MEQFISVQEDLLKIERLAETKKATEVIKSTGICLDLEKRGIAILNLKADGFTTNCGDGNVEIAFRPYRKKLIPSHLISSGDNVGVFLHTTSLRSTTNLNLCGLVLDCTKSSIKVSFSDYIASSLSSVEKKYLLIKLDNDVTHKRLKRALFHLRFLLTNSSHSPLVNVLFGICPPGASFTGPYPKPFFIMNVLARLSLHQIGVVDFCLRQPDLAVIHGPPGTGKTTTLVEVIAQSVACGAKVLCCAPSNVAVDNMLDMLATVGGNGINILRLGRPAKVKDEFKKFCLETLVSHSEEAELIQDVYRDIHKVLSKLGCHSTLSPTDRIELKKLRKEVRLRESKVIRRLMESADVVLATLTSACSYDGPIRHIKKGKFALVAIDECSQALEISCWIALHQAPKAVLAGDHCQLPPTVLSQEASSRGFSKSLLERIVCDSSLRNLVVRKLSVQYRMNGVIMRWASHALYEGSLVCHSDDVENRLLNQLPGVRSDENTSVPLIFIDTSGCDCLEMESVDGGDESSRSNSGEADIVHDYVTQLIDSGVKPGDIAVISPYNAQVQLLRGMLQANSEDDDQKSLFEELEIQTVDGFQGREKEAIVLSLVRSNLTGNVGFLRDFRRLNVAVTRARRQVAVVGDVDCVRSESFLAGFIAYVGQNGILKSAHSDFGKAVKRQGQLVKLMEDFDRSNTDLVLPITLTSYERMKVHAMAEAKGYFHTSTNIGSSGQRQLFLSKSKCVEIKEPEHRKDESLTTNSTTDSKLFNRSEKTDDSNLRNFDWSVLMAREEETQKVITKKEEENSISTNSKFVYKKKKKASKPAFNEKTEDDAFMNNMIRLNLGCAHLGCLVPHTQLIGVNCVYCHLRFCLTHVLPEVHGCGTDARKAAIKEFRNHSAADKEKYTQKSIKRAQLKNALYKKVSNLEELRRKKKKA